MIQLGLCEEMGQCWEMGTLLGGDIFVVVLGCCEERTGSENTLYSEYMVAGMWA